MIDTKRAMTILAEKSQLYEKNIWLPSINELAEEKYDVVEQVASKLLREPRLSLEVIFRCYAFARGGGADRAGYHRISVLALRQVTSGSSFKELAREEVGEEILWQEFQDQCIKRNIGINEKMNKELIKGLLKLSREDHDCNIAAYLRDGIQANISNVFCRLNEIKGIGPKIASFIIRDSAWLFNLESKIPDQYKRYLQPVDIWLGRTALCFWPKLNRGYWSLVDRLTEECINIGISCIKLNQGAWYFGAQEVKDYNILCDELTKL